MKMSLRAYCHINWHLFIELSIVIIYIILLNNYLGRKNVVIQADGKGYYEYLPAIVIYKDLNFVYADTLQTDFYDHKKEVAGYTPTINGKKVDKYFIGTAVLQLPFFATAHLVANLTQDYSADGFSLIYQEFISYAALFYLFLGLIFIRKSLHLLKTNFFVIILLQFAVLFATSLMYYAHALASFSHVYSFALVSAFMYFVLEFSISKSSYAIIFAGVFFGLIVLVRPVNGLILLFVPFLFNSFNSFIEALAYIMKYKLKQLSIAIALALLILSIQPIIWYYQTGLWWIKPYENETLILSKPNILKFLFSYRKGFFIYAPIFFVMIMASIINLITQKKLWRLGTFLFAFFSTVYILSSWHVWFYGASFGSRVMIDYYPPLIIFGSFAINHFNPFGRWSLAFAAVLLSYIAVVQTFQYDKFILDWVNMNKEKYWQTFLKTEDKYKGLYFLQRPNTSRLKLIYSTEINDTVFSQTKPDSITTIFGKQIYSFNNYLLNKIIITIKADVCYNSGNDLFIVKVIDEDGNFDYYFQQEIFKAIGKNDYQGETKLFYCINLSSNKRILEVNFMRKEAKSVYHNVAFDIFDASNEIDN